MVKTERSSSDENFKFNKCKLNFKQIDCVSNHIEEISDDYEEYESWDIAESHRQELANQNQESGYESNASDFSAGQQDTYGHQSESR